MIDPTRYAVSSAVLPILMLRDTWGDTRYIALCYFGVEAVGEGVGVPRDPGKFEGV